MPASLNHDLFDAVRQTIGAINLYLRASGTPAASLVAERLAQQSLHDVEFHEPPAGRLPVLRYFPECVGAAMVLAPGVAAGLAAVEDHLNWRQTAAYSDALLGHGFSANYGWAELIGPNGFFAGDDFLLGLLMLGPNRHYLDHYHPAPELYWPLTSGAQWRKSPGGLEEKPAGALIWHEPNQIHATRTGDAPLLAVWAWIRDTVTAAKLVDQA